jgi:bifunctional enzyme CysN/CysC
VVLTSFISPFTAERRFARELIGDDRFIEVFIDTPLPVAEQRDPKGLYEKARRGELMNFTGIDSPYEPPDTPEVRIDTTTVDADTAARHIAELLTQLAVDPGPAAG